MTESQERLIKQLDNAIKAVKDFGEDCYICDGLHIAKDIVEAGPDADAAQIAKTTLEGFGI